MLKLPTVTAVLDRLRHFPPVQTDEWLAAGLAAKLYGPVLRTSISRMEQFAACPFKFFVHSGLRAETRKRFELDIKEQGSFQHDVLAMFHEQLLREIEAEEERRSFPIFAQRYWHIVEPSTPFIPTRLFYVLCALLFALRRSGKEHWLALGLLAAAVLAAAARGELAIRIPVGLVLALALMFWGSVWRAFRSTSFQVCRAPLRHRSSRAFRSRTGAFRPRSSSFPATMRHASGFRNSSPPRPRTLRTMICRCRKRQSSLT